MPFLRILCYNGSLVTWTIVSLTAAKFKPLMFFLSDESRRVLGCDRRSEYRTHLGLTTRFLLLLDNCAFIDVGRSLWRDDESVVYNCCWPLPAQSFSGPSPVGLVTVFYCLRFETSHFVAYHSQGYGGGIRPPPPHPTGSCGREYGPRYVALVWTAQKTPLPLLCACLLRLSRDDYWCIAYQRACFQSRSLATAHSAGFTILAFGRHATIRRIHTPLGNWDSLTWEFSYTRLPTQDVTQPGSQSRWSLINCFKLNLTMKRFCIFSAGLKGIREMGY
jgi:hypothetical protein